MLASLGQPMTLRQFLFRVVYIWGLSGQLVSSTLTTKMQRDTKPLTSMTVVHGQQRETVRVLTALVLAGEHKPQELYSMVGTMLVVTKVT